MRFHSHIGVYQEEKKLGQNIEINLVVDFNIDETTIKDRVERTISYAAFYTVIAEIVKNSQVNLIETLALEIINEIKKIDQEHIGTVKVNLKKLAVPIDGIFDNVEIEMER
ncbi:hypothetical protein FC81_GL001346 [Liquorilactobacillus capillatus DSM 19910]|uniref:7,8-dihydroneopterin aldolase n=2 Tax=Liquorilactobacillus capillatus TaxID=480931 RepID=A0A0R1M815_9LACO|nr:hypothetical protein FC81_GL001346 [Liquorilactobacillus capillatus DSM 19910]